MSSVGGKNSSLGEMISKLSSKGVRVPNGFATTAQSYDEFLQFNNLAEKIEKKLSSLDVEDITALKRVGSEIRKLYYSVQISA